ncbi:MAG TPA: response regulator [Bryobacteraceae bacterium]
MQPQDKRAVILLADDEPVVRNLVQMALTYAGYHVLSASDGAEALNLSRSYDGVIDLLIGDAEMPNLTGPELAKTVSKERPDMQILLMAAELRDEIPQQLRLELLRKPFVPKLLLERVHSILFRRPS